jgi:hypothetical protein
MELLSCLHDFAAASPAAYKCECGRSHGRFVPEAAAGVMLKLTGPWVCGASDFRSGLDLQDAALGGLFFNRRRLRVVRI